MAWQDREIKRVSFHLESVASNLRKKEQQMAGQWLAHQRVVSLEAENRELRRAISQMNREQNRKIEDLEKEKRALLEELEGYEDYIEDQVNEMRKISYYIDRLSEEKGHLDEINRERQAEDSLAKFMVLYEDLLKKNESFACGCPLKNQGVSNFEKMLKELERSQKIEKMHHIKSLERQIAAQDDNNRILLKRLDDERAAKADLEKALQSMSNNEGNLKEMLRQAIKSTSQKLEEVEGLRKQSNGLKAEVRRLKEQVYNQLEVAEQSKKKLEDYEKRILMLMQKNAELRSRRGIGGRRAVILIEKNNTGDDEVNYRYVCGFEAKEEGIKRAARREDPEDVKKLKRDVPKTEDTRLKRELERMANEATSLPEENEELISQMKTNDLGEETDVLQEGNKEVEAEVDLNKAQSEREHSVLSRSENPQDQIMEEIERLQQANVRAVPTNEEDIKDQMKTDDLGEETDLLQKDRGKFESEILRLNSIIEKLQVEIIDLKKSQPEKQDLVLSRSESPQDQIIDKLEVENQQLHEEIERLQQANVRAVRTDEEDIKDQMKTSDLGEETDLLQNESEILRLNSIIEKLQVEIMDLKKSQPEKQDTPDHLVLSRSESPQDQIIDKLEVENQRLHEEIERLQQANLRAVPTNEENIKNQTKTNDLGEETDLLQKERKDESEILRLNSIIEKLQVEIIDLKKSQPEKQNTPEHLVLTRSENPQDQIIDKLEVENQQLRKEIERLQQANLRAVPSNQDQITDQMKTSDLGEETDLLQKDRKKDESEILRLNSIIEKLQVEIIDLKKSQPEKQDTPEHLVLSRSENPQDQIIDKLEVENKEIERYQAKVRANEEIMKLEDQLQSLGYLMAVYQPHSSGRQAHEEEVQTALATCSRRDEGSQYQPRMAPSSRAEIEALEEEIQKEVVPLQLATYSGRLDPPNQEEIQEEKLKIQEELKELKEETANQPSGREEAPYKVEENVMLKAPEEATNQKKIVVTSDFQRKYQPQMATYSMGGVEALEEVIQKEVLATYSRRLEAPNQEEIHEENVKMQEELKKLKEEMAKQPSRTEDAPHNNEDNNAGLKAPEEATKQKKVVVSNGFQTEQINELEEQLLDKTQENERLKVRAENLEKKLNDEIQKNTHQENENIQERSSEELLDEWQKTCANDISRLRQEMEEFMMMPERCEAHGDRIRELENELERARLRIDKLERDNASLTIENENCLRRDLDADHPDMQIVDHLTRLEKKNDVLKTRTVQLELDNGRLRNELERLMGKDTKGLERELQRLRNVDKHAAKCQEKFKLMKKRLMRLEIENRNLKKEYIYTLIEKEKLVLRGHEQDRRLREISKLWKKTQEKKQSLMNRTVKLQVENENLKQQIDSILTKDLEQRMEKFADTEDNIRAKSVFLENENEELRDLLLRVQATSPDPNLCKRAMALLSKPKDEDLKFQLIQLDLENENLKKQLEEMKAKEMLVEVEDLGVDVSKLEGEEDREELKIAELQIENEYLKNELKDKDQGEDSNVTERRLGELEEEVQRLVETKENLQKVTVELELDNEYLKKELERISQIQQSLQPDQTEKDLEKENHTLKMKIDNLETEIRKLQKQIEEMGVTTVSLEVHAQQKLLREIHRLFRDYESVKHPSSGATGSRSDIQERMRSWREKYEPQLLSLKEDLDRLKGRDSRVEDQLRRCRELELDNKNQRVALEILLNEKGVLSNVRLVKQVEEQLRKSEDQDARDSVRKEEQEMAALKVRLENSLKVNQMLRKEKISLSSHRQEKKIKELEEQLKEQEEQMSYVFTASQARSQVTRIQNLEGELEAVRAKRDELKREVDNLTAERDLLSTSLQFQSKECQNDKDEMQMKLDRLHKVNEVQQKQKADLKKQLEEMRRSDSDTSIARPRRVNFVDSPSQMDYAELLKNEFRKLHAKHEECKKKVADLDAELRRCRDVNRDLKRRLEKLGDGGEASEDEKKNGQDSKRQKDDDEDEGHEENAAPADDSYEVHQLKRENSDLRKKILEMERSLESQVSGDIPKEDYEKLREESSLLQKRVKELEERLREANTKCRTAKFELQKEQFSAQDRRSQRRASELEAQLLDSRTENQIHKVKLENLRKEVRLKEASDEENKNLKDQLNSLTRRLVSSDEENKRLKDEVNRWKHRRNELLLEIKDHKRDILKLEKRIEEKIRENESLQTTISDLKEKLVEAEDANEFLKTQVTKLDEEKRALESEYREQAQRQAPDRINALEDKIQKCQLENESLVQVTLKLEEEVQSLKKDLARLVENDQRVKSVPEDARMSKKSEILEQELGEQKRKWKSTVSKLTEQYEENICRLKKRLQSMVPGAPRGGNVLQPWMVQPVLWQPMMAYSSYLPPQILVDPVKDDAFSNLESVMGQIQKTLEDSTKVIFGAEEEEAVWDYEAEATSRTWDIAANVAELNKQFWKQQETKAKIETLQKDVQQTMKDLRELSQRSASSSLNRNEGSDGSSSEHAKPESKPEGRKLPSASPSRVKRSGSKMDE